MACCMISDAYRRAIQSKTIVIKSFPLRIKVPGSFESKSLVFSSMLQKADVFETTATMMVSFGKAVGDVSVVM